MTTSGEYKMKNLRRRTELGFRIPHDVEGYAVEPESRGGRDGG